jgi:uncharacterized protein with NAD-binding domain and iron-sulfur cluster
VARKRRIAILGGGFGALAAAFELTARSDWRDRYEVTVYQVGWRLGGKCATGRNAAFGDRIEEHGLHVLFGFYENAFWLLRRCYAELERPADAPLRTWSDAFERQDEVVWAQRRPRHPHPDPVPEGEGTARWVWWRVPFGRRPGLPGDGAAALAKGELERSPTVLDYLLTCLEVNTQQFFASAGGPPWWLRIESVAAVLLRLLGRRVCRQAELFEALVLRLVRGRLDRRARHRDLRADALAGPLRALEASLRSRQESVEAAMEHSPEAFRLWSQAYLALVMVKGLVADGALVDGFDPLDDEELEAWLTRHGAPRILLDSPFLHAAYDMVFGFAGGRTTRPAIGAGTALRGCLRAFAYRGSNMWRMRAGTGDTVFMPLYEVLAKRGVTFEFFHRVTALQPSADGTRVERVRLRRQVALVQPYVPWVVVRGLRCWPNEPRYEQIEDGARLRELLRRAGATLESPDWTSEEFGRDVALERGRDFDDVVLGISLGGLADITRELAATKRPWADMLRHVRTTATQAFQLWLRPPLDELGWPAAMASPILAGFVQPIDTWADMSHLLRWENWPEGTRPRSVAYFCGPMTDTEQATERARDEALRYIKHDLPTLWPALRQRPIWELLVSPNGRCGAAGLDDQYYRANTEGSERYVQSVPGSLRHRLPADDSGFSNLVLAGDWTRNGMNSGCVEAAVMSGLQAARALSGTPTPIYGETDV